MKTEEEKIAILKKKTQKELLESIAYDIDAIRGYVRIIGVAFLFAIVLGVFIGIGIAVSSSK